MHDCGHDEDAGVRCTYGKSSYTCTHVWMYTWGRPWPNRHSSCTTNVCKLDAYTYARARAGSILSCASMRLGCQVSVD